MKIAALFTSSLIAGLACASTPESRALELRSMSVGEDAKSAIDAISDLIVECFPRTHEPGHVQFCTVYAQPFSDYSTKGLEEFNFTVDVEGRVEKVTQRQPVTWFEDTREALTRKFGPPASDTSSEATNSFGATLDQRELAWVKDGVRLTFIKRLRANESAIDLRREESESDREERIERAGKRI